MTNREKYRFDDFTLDNYRHLVSLAKERGFEFISFSEPYDSERKDILWRHDVEFEPDIALRMAEIENTVGAKATYFFQMHSPYYNIFDPHYTQIFHQIKNLGHDVGLHFDSHYYGITDENQLNKYIELDKSYFEKVLNVKIASFSFHNTTPFTRDCLEYQYGGLINVYSSHFKHHFRYCGDSLGYWRFEILEDVLKDPKIFHLQVLSHDANWSEEVLSPRKRMRQFLFDRAQKLYEGQVFGLMQKGLLCPDDED